ncbi:MAG: RluA family pseudouridine synthase [Planctomycetota bacterium]
MNVDPESPEGDERSPRPEGGATGPEDRDTGLTDPSAPPDSADPRPGPISLEVEPDANAPRLDAWLATHFPDLSRSALKRVITDGRVSIDSKVPKPSSRLEPGQTVVVDLPPPPPPLPIPQDLPLELIHEDDALIVIHKSPDMVVHPSPGVTAGGTVVNALLSHTDELSTEGGDFRPGIVHRLDRETSGVMLIARTDIAHRKLAAQFKEREVHKEYLAFVHGIPKEPEGDIDLPLGRSLAHRKKMAVRHDDEGKASRTRWRTVRTVGEFAWIHCFPETGRTHQIRLHLKAIGHPIVCDATYGREKRITVSEVRGRRPRAGEELVLCRQALHAYRIEFTHPTTAESAQFTSELPDDLRPLWEIAQPV